MNTEEKNDKAFKKVQEILANHKPDPNQKFIQEVTPLRFYSKSFFVDGEFNTDIIHKLIEPYRKSQPIELFLFMNDYTLRMYHSYWKILGSTTGFIWNTQKIGGKSFQVDKVNFGNVTLISLAPEIFDYPKYYKSGITPENNEIFIVTSKNIKPFVKELKILEKPYIKLLKERGIK